MVQPNDTHLIPEQPGVYLMKGEGEKVLYVGKAGNLRTRVRAHIQGTPGSGGFYRSFVPLVRDIAYLVTDNEVEALLLEYNLIKEHDPEFNVRLKDDKRYPYIKVTLAEPFPRVFLTRTLAQDGSRYFGPYPHVKEARTTLNALKELFPIRQCRVPCERLRRRTRPCLNYEMRKCLGPCSGKITREEYDVLVKGIVDFLSGRTRSVLSLAERKMKDYSALQHYEKAAVFRDILRAIEATSTQQRVSGALTESEDYIALDSVAEMLCVSVLRNRQGRLVGGEYFFLDNAEHAETPERIRAFLRDFYALSTDIPPEIVLPVELEEQASLEEWLRSHSGHGVTLHCPQRGRKVRVLELARQNAHFRAQERYLKMHGLHEEVDLGVIQIQEILGMPHPPMRIECFDIANISGRDAVGSMVVFQNGAPAKSAYRRFKIQRTDQPDDYAMMREMLERRFQHTDEAFGTMPDLILIDGGKGHLNVALGVLQKYSLPIPALALAKQEEDLYLPDQDYPLALDRGEASLKLLVSLRDEAHRFAQDYHHRVRRKSSQFSFLDGVSGIGPSRRKALLKAFGSIKAIREATVEQLTSISGITEDMAMRIQEHLKKR